jgi:hypothetical protein
LNDPLNGQGAGGWDQGFGAQGSCQFANNTLQASIQQAHTFTPCFARATNFSNFAFQVQIRILKGDEGGIVFRANSNQSTGYLILIGQDGNYTIYAARDATHIGALAGDRNAAINTGLNRANLITIIARNSTLSLYINKQFVTAINDTTFNSGEIGVAGADLTNPTVAAFSNAQVWAL